MELPSLTIPAPVRVVSYFVLGALNVALLAWPDSFGHADLIGYLVKVVGGLSALFFGVAGSHVVKAAVTTSTPSLSPADTVAASGLSSDDLAALAASVPSAVPSTGSGQLDPATADYVGEHELPTDSTPASSQAPTA